MRCYPDQIALLDRQSSNFRWRCSFGALFLQAADINTLEESADFDFCKAKRHTHEAKMAAQGEAGQPDLSPWRWNRGKARWAADGSGRVQRR